MDAAPLTPPVAADLDLDLPIATLLREGTAAAHQSAETSEGAGWLTRGELDKEEYVRFLIMLYHVYRDLEQGLERHAAHPVLSPTYNPTLFARTDALLSDIAHLLRVPTATVLSDPLFQSTTTHPPPALATYTARLRALADGPDPSPLLAHAYVRYLGDLSGGQFIRRRVARAYALEDDDGAGVAFYEFSKLGGGRGAGIGDMKKIKEWFRDGMNAGVGDNRDLKVIIVAEANKAFEFNAGLFAALKPPSNPPSPPPSPSPTLAHPTLGDPTSPVATEPKEKSFARAQEGPIEIYSAPENARDEGTFTTEGVVAFILAMCLAHFVLVVGGFTGARGWDKLEAAQAWIEGLFA